MTDFLSIMCISIPKTPLFLSITVSRISTKKPLIYIKKGVLNDSFLPLFSTLRKSTSKWSKIAPREHFLAFFEIKVYSQ